MGLKEDLLKEIRKLFDTFTETENTEMKKTTYKQIQWEIDNFVYPFIGSYIAEGRLTKEEGRDIFLFCELKLREIKLKETNKC